LQGGIHPVNGAVFFFSRDGDRTGADGRRFFRREVVLCQELKATGFVWQFVEGRQCGIRCQIGVMQALP